MKLLTRLTCGAAALAAAFTLTAHAASVRPGQVDFGTFSPPAGGGQFVEINISDTLFSLATSLVEKPEPALAGLLKGLHRVHVTVVGLDDQNRGELKERMATIRKDLDAKAWERVVTVRQQAQDVAIFLKTAEGNSVEGLVVTVLEEGKQAVFINVVGNIRPDQLSLLGERFRIEELKKAGKAVKR
jgi:hypothetical protein